jgi:hypothetical protein
MYSYVKCSHVKSPPQYLIEIFFAHDYGKNFKNGSFESVKIFFSRSAYCFKASFLTIVILFGFKPLGKLTWYSLIFASNSGLYIFLKITQVKLSSRMFLFSDSIKNSLHEIISCLFTSSLILMELSNYQREVNTFNMRKNIASRFS